MGGAIFSAVRSRRQTLHGACANGRIGVYCGTVVSKPWYRESANLGTTSTVSLLVCDTKLREALTHVRTFDADVCRFRCDAAENGVGYQLASDAEVPFVRFELWEMNIVHRLSHASMISDRSTALTVLIGIVIAPRKTPRAKCWKALGDIQDICSDSLALVVREPRPIQLLRTDLSLKLLYSRTQNHLLKSIS